MPNLRLDQALNATGQPVNPTQALDMGGPSKNIKFDHAHVGETGGGAATIIANTRVNASKTNRVDYAQSNEDGIVRSSSYIPMGSASSRRLSIPLTRP
jgi:hypothetical protein